jgi:hypothetical protein
LLTAGVTNNGNSTEHDVHIALYVDSVLVTEETFGELDTFESQLISYMWTPNAVGVYNITAIVDPVPDEVSLSNNIREKSVLVEEQEEFTIISPSSGQTVSGSIIHIEYQTDYPYNINAILVYVNGEHITDTYYMGAQELMVPIFQNGTNTVLLEVYWYGGDESWASVQIQSIDVHPTVVPVPGDYFNWVNDYGEYYESMNFTFGEMVSQFEVEVEAEFAIWYQGEIVDVYNTLLIVNILNGYVADDMMGGMTNGHLFFLSGLRSPAATGTSAETGDMMPMYGWSDIFHITGQAIWNGYAVWRLYSQDLGNYASVFRYNGILATLYYYNGTGSVVDTSFFPLPDNSPPVWLSAPNDFVAEAGEMFWYQFQVYDDSGIAGFTVNNTLFSLTLSGLLTNTVPLHVGTYNLEVIASDPFGHELTGHISILVEDHTPPEWLSPLGNLVINFGDVLLVAVTAEDFSGIDYYLVNNTGFTVTAQGVLMSIIQLQSGVYWLNITVFDVYGNMNSMVISVTVRGSSTPPDMFLVLLVGGFTVLVVAGLIVILLVRKRAT